MGESAKAAYRAQAARTPSQTAACFSGRAQHTSDDILGSTSWKTMIVTVEINSTNTLLQGYNTERLQIYEICCLNFLDNEILRINQEFIFIPVPTIFDSLLTLSPKNIFFHIKSIHFQLDPTAYFVRNKQPKDNNVLLNSPVKFSHQANIKKPHQLLMSPEMNKATKAQGGRGDTWPHSSEQCHITV